MITNMSFLEMSFYGGIFIIAITILRSLAGQRLPKYTMLALWAAAFLRLSVPLTVASPVNIYSAAGQLTQTAMNYISLPSEVDMPDRSELDLNPVQTAGSGLPDASGLNSTISASGEIALQSKGVLTTLLFGNPAAQVTGLYALLTVLWIAGSIIAALGFLISHIRGIQVYKTSLPVNHPFIQQWLYLHRLRRPIQIRICDQIDSPLTYGILWPVILLPKRHYNNEQLSFILAHELAHIRRFDTLTKWLLAVLVCIHWFNPLVWVMYILANRDLELSCDDYVIRLHGRKTRTTYALTLVSLEEHRAHCSPLSNSFCKNAMKERITAIMKSKKPTAGGTAAAFLLIAAIVILFGPTASQNASQTMAAEIQTNEALQVSTPLISGSSLENNVKSSASAGDSGNPFSDNDYTHFSKEKYDKVVEKLKFDNYENMSIAEFNRKLNAAFHTEDKAADSYDEDFIEMYEIVLNTLPSDDPNEVFLRTTVNASLNEYNTRLTEVYSGKAADPDFSANAEITEEADIFGDKVTMNHGWISYRFTYKILDQDKLTVKERDKFLSDITSGMENVLRSKKLTINDSGNTRKAEKLLEAIGKSVSGSHITFTGGSVSDFELNWEE